MEPRRHLPIVGASNGTGPRPKVPPSERASADPQMEPSSAPRPKPLPTVAKRGGKKRSGSGLPARKVIRVLAWARRVTQVACPNPVSRVYVTLSHILSVDSNPITVTVGDWSTLYGNGS